MPSSPLSSPTTMLTIKTTLLQEKRRFQIPLATPSDDNNNQHNQNNNNNTSMYDMIRKKIVQLYQLNPDYDTFLIQYKDDDDDDIIVTSDDDLHVAIRCMNRTLTKKLSSLDNQMMGSSGSGDIVLHLSVAKTLNHSQSAVDGSSVGIGAIVDRIVEDQSSSSSSRGVNVIAAATADGNGDRNNHNDVNKSGNRSSNNLLGRISRMLKDKNRRRRHRHHGSSNNDNNDDENDHNTDHVVNEEGVDDNDGDGDDVDDDVDDADLDDLGADSSTSFDEEESEHNTRSISNVLTAHTSTEYLDHEITSTSFYFPHALQKHHHQQQRQNNSDVVVSSKLASKENQQPTTTGRSSPVPMATLHPSNYQGIIPPASPSSTPPPLVPSQYYISMYQQQSNGGSNIVYPQQGYYHVPYGNLVGAASHVDSPLPSHPHHPYFTHPQVAAYHLGATGNTTANNRSYSPSAQFMQQQNAALGLVSGDMGVGPHRIPFLHELPPVPSLAQTMALYEEPIPLKLQLKLLKLEFQFKRQLLMNEYKQQFLQLKRDNAKPNSRLDKKLQVQMTNIRLTAQKQRLLITHQQEKVLNSFEKLRLKRKNVAVDDVDLSSRLMWPNNLEKVYVHGNNMFAFNPLKKYAKKDRDFANKIVIDLCSAFFGEMQNLSLVHVVFDNTGRVVDTVDPNHANRSFTVSSAASQQKDADDVIIDFAMYSRKNTGVGMPETSVFVTCDRDLRQVLKQFGCKCIHPQRFLEFIYIILDGHDRTFDDWLTQDFIH